MKRLTTEIKRTVSLAKMIMDDFDSSFIRAFVTARSLIKDHDAQVEFENEANR